MAADPQDAPNDLDEDLFDFPVVAPFGAPESATSSVAGGDDLFDDGDQGVRAALQGGGALEDDIDRLTDQVSGMIEDDDLDGYVEGAPAAPRPTAVPPATAPAPEAAAPSAHPPAADPIVAAAAPAPTPAPVSAAPVAFGRAGGLLIGGAALFALLLLGVVWNASRGLQQALSARPAAAATEDAALQQRIAELEATLATQRAELLAALDERGEERLSGLPQPSDVEPAWSVERTLIDEALEDGRYREARRRLFGLQAVLDDLDETVAAELAPTIAFLIPETYRLQAQARGEER